MTIAQLAIAAFAVGGVAFAVFAAVGLVRLPDLYARAHAASKADTLGAVLALAAVAITFGPSLAALKTGLLILFMFLTNPTAVHAIARTAADQGIEPWTVEGGER